jgi:uncharacterized membrane protein YdbT with pleckstrin-like domain
VTYPKRLIHNDEEVLLDARPHWWQLVGPALVAVVAVGGSAVVFVIWSGAPQWFGWVLLGIGASGTCYLLGRFLRWRSTDLVVTSMRVIYRGGVVGRWSREIPISNVQDVSYVQSLVGRVIGRGELFVESAGSRGEKPFRGVSRPEVAQGLINRSIEESRQRGSGRLAPRDGVSVAEELDHLGALHRRGVITDGEFARLKAELIGPSGGELGDDEFGES